MMEVARAFLQKAQQHSEVPYKLVQKLVLACKEMQAWNLIHSSGMQCLPFAISYLFKKKKRKRRGVILHTCTFTQCPHHPLCTHFVLTLQLVSAMTNVLSIRRKATVTVV